MIENDFIDVLVNQPIASGGHVDRKDAACVMEKVGILWALHVGLDVRKTWSDAPPCTNHIVAELARHVNDQVADESRQKLNQLIPRLLRARRIPYKDRRIGQRLLLWLVRTIETDEEFLQAANAYEEWLHQPARKTRLAFQRAYRQGLGICDGYQDGYCLTAMSQSFLNSRSKVHVEMEFCEYIDCKITSFDGDEQVIQLLSGCLDAWEEAVSKEGEDIYVPRPWEDAALSFFASSVTV